MAIENAKMLNVRIKNKYDSYENWAKSNLVLEAGEIAIAHTTVDVQVDNGTAKHPALLMKVGNGTDTFANLPWLSAKAADVVAACKSETALTEFVNTVIGNAGIATDEAMQKLAGRVTTVEGDLNTEKTGLKARVATAEEAIEALQGLVGDKGSVEAQINAAIAALNLADTYAAKSHKHEIADVNGLSDSIAAAKKAGDDAAEALETYKTLNDAAVKVNSDAIAAIKKDATITTFKGIEDILAGKQAAGDYSVVGHKHEIADVNGLADSIADAKKAGTDAAGVAAANATAIEALQSKVGESSVEAQINTKISNLDLPNTYDAKGAAAQALTDAKAYTDGKDSAMNTRVAALEAIDHDHANAAELAKIVDGDVAKWNAAEQNAKDYADDLDEAMDVRVKALEGKFTGESSVAAQIEAAVAAEAKLRDDADKVLQGLIESNDAEILALQGLVGESSVESRVNAEKERAMAAEKVNADAIKAISDDYLKAADKEALQTQINTIMNNPDAEGAINSINEFTQYIADHGEVAEGFRAGIDANKDDIEALSAYVGDIPVTKNIVDEVVIAPNGADYQNIHFNEKPEYGKTYGIHFQKKGYADGWYSGVVDTRANKYYTIPITTQSGEILAYVDYDIYNADNSRITFVNADKNAEYDFSVTWYGSDANTVVEYIDEQFMGLSDKINAFEYSVNYNHGLLIDRIGEAEDDIDALEEKVGDSSVQAQIDAALKVEVEGGAKVDKYALATDLTDAVVQHNTDKAALEASIAKKANDADLAAIAKTGSTDDLIQGAMTLVFDCGGAGV